MGHEEAEIEQRRRGARYMLRLSFWSGASVLLLAVLVAQVAASTSMRVPLIFTMWLAIAVSAVTGGLFVANSSFAENTILRGFLGFLIAPVIAAVLVFLSFAAYLFSGGPIH